ncbi:MAG TPA: DEAD/DEAH box helicase [bacterium]|nr:DEAD/DEAH box helicase [bacterium]
MCEQQQTSPNQFVDQLCERRHQAYKASPGDIREHFGIEQVVLAGGYGYRQILELVQNGADAILEAHECGTDLEVPCKIEVLLDGSNLYVANTGAPFSEDGIDALLRSHSSPKRGMQIGRFGLGFKSLLRLGGRIDITSGSFAFGFDPERCRTELKDRYKVQEAPGLRLAWSLEEDRAEELRGKFPWATTVVCAEILSRGFREHLGEEIDGFPAEFLLFLPVPVQLMLANSDSPESKREIHRVIEGQDVVLHEGESKSRWRVVEHVVPITDRRAREDATHVHSRDKVPLAWAMPVEGKREEAGGFWAFFPTQTPTYLAGILNAPWKLNSDRNAIISGEWNTALMQEAAKLIADALPELSTMDDVGRPLDAFPRQIDRSDEIAKPLVETLWDALQESAVIADSLGTLRRPQELWRHPRDNADLARRWCLLANSDSLKQVVHPSCLEGLRASRLRALAERIAHKEKMGSALPRLEQCDAEKWFAEISSLEIDRAVQVLRLTAAFADDCKPGEWSQIRPKLALIPSDEGKLLTPDQSVFAPEGTIVPDGRHAVDSRLFAVADARRILTDVLKVKPLDDNVWVVVLNETLPRMQLWQTPPDGLWCAFWNLLRSAPEKARAQFMSQNAARIRVKRRDGRWALPFEALIPGALVSSDDASDNRMVLVDDVVHADDAELLAELKVCEFPQGVVSVDNPDGLGDWLSHWRSHYKRSENERASWKYLKPYNLKLPAGWHFLAQLAGLPNARLTEHFLSLLGEDGLPVTVRFGHSTVSTYSRICVSHPLLWLMLRHGTWNIEGTTIPLVAIVDRRDEPSIVQILGQQFQPAFDKLGDAIPKVTATTDDIREMWQALIRMSATPAVLRDDSLRDLWLGAARDGVVPQSLPTDQGEIPLAHVFVTESQDLASRARAQGNIAITLDAQALSLWLANGARDLAELMKPEWIQPTGPAELLISVFPEMSEVLKPEIKDSARCQPVAGLTLMIAGAFSPLYCLLWEGILFLDGPQLALLSRAERLQHLLSEAGSAGWLSHDPEECLSILGDVELERRRNHVSQGASLAERLWRAVGEREEPLRQALGYVGGLDFLQGVTALRLAELVLAQIGPATLATLKETLESEGLKPPIRWNTTGARAFVASIGFPAEFAASPELRREPEEYISGPIELPALHDFQDEVVRGIRDLIASGSGRRRAVVSLPTGGGKTRATVQAAVEFVLKAEDVNRSVIWVAQTDELCEQAVQAFRQVWLNLGAKQTDLRIVRLWGGNPNPAFQESGKPIVVVASIQTLNHRMGTEGLTWFQRPGLVVVDECHYAIAPSYTNLLRFLDAATPRQGAPSIAEPPILGLSATPFRADDEESERLARRFDRRWLPKGQADLHRHLRSQGILAEVCSESLDSGIGLTAKEIEQLSNIPDPWEGVDFENIVETINQRLAKSQQRNERIVEFIRGAAQKAILLFANSVVHAQEMAARLNLKGVSSAAIGGETPMTSRRFFLSRFQSGDIRVLCNHSVLSTGFDAPKTDMVLISRAVFSPVRYMQMVGRGLRGEKNGGTASCRIVTVLDNLGRFQERHPYHYCGRYFMDHPANLP